MSGDREEFNSEKFAESLLTPRGFLRLLDDTVFQFNDIYRRFWRNGGDSLSRAEEGGPKESWVVPAMFDKQSRTFNWVALADPLLESEHTSRQRFKKITAVVKEFHSVFKNNDVLQSKFKSLFDDSPHSFEAIQILYAEIEIYSEYGCQDLYESHLSENPVHAEDVFYAFASIYSSYSHPRQHSFEGCFFRALEKFGHTEPHVVQDAIFGDVNGGFIQLENWRKSRALPDESWSLISWNAQEIVTIEEPRIIQGKPYYYQPCRKTFSDLVFETMLENAYMSWEIDFDVSAKPITVSDYLASHNFILLMPIYDVWIGPVGYGGLQAVLLIFLKPPKEEERAGKIGHTRWENVYHKKILNRCEGFAEKLAGTAIRRAIATPIAPPYDLVSHFLKILAEVQDWEEAVVYRGGNPSYCFRRSGPLKADFANPTQQYLRVRIPWELDKAFAQGIPTGPHTQSGSIAVVGKEMYMWWTCEQGAAENATRPHYNLWSDYFLPELTDEERLTFQDLSIRFKFPKASRIPPLSESASRDYLVEAYLRQQLELMRALIPKVRARRAALRNAVSAIMGRNMSHNIGSHVLARYAAGIVQQLPNPDYADPRTDFLSYLQRRMDFLAEVATADQSFWTQPLALRSQLERLNYRVQCERFYGTDSALDDQRQYPPLLKFITGKDKLRANVEYVAFPGCSNDGLDRLLFSCPGGEVGVHALYVIIENVIRNSARHNGEAGGTVEIEVRAKDRSFQGVDCGNSFSKTDWKGLIEIHVLDYRSKLRSDGRSVSSDKEAGEAWKWTDKLEAKKDKKGKRIQLDVIPDDINCMIRNEPILEADGTPSPHYWGLREMQICAQYLRQLRLSDLENIPYADREAVVGKVPLIRAECAKYGEGTDEYCLSYVFYVREAALLVTIEKAPREAPTSFAPVYEAPGLAKLMLGRQDIERSAEPETASVLDKALRELRNYAFAANTKEVAGWVDRHLGELPVRRLELPSSDSALTLKEAQQLFESSAADPLAKMEKLHEAYANKLHGNGTILAGIVLGKKEAITEAFEGEEAIMPLDVRLEDDGGNEWADWWQRASSGEDSDRLPLDACVWLDHPSDKSFAAISDKARRNPAADIRIVSCEACFSNSVASEALRSLQPGQGWELIAASLPRVAILDERVQGGAEEQIRENLTTKTCWEGMRVYVPERPKCINGETLGDGQVVRQAEGQVARADLDQPTFNSCRAFLSSLPHSMDYLVLHLTILERFSKVTGKGIRESIHELVKGTKASDAQIVIVTGRGVPTFAQSFEDNDQRDKAPNTKNYFRFLPVSSLLEYLLLRPSKLGLMRVLWSASSPARRSQ